MPSVHWSKSPALQFITPPRRPAEYEESATLAFPEADHEDWRLNHLFSEELSEKFRRVPSLWRNLVALYLRSAGVPTSEIASFLEISSSRVNGIVAKSRKLVGGRASKAMRGKPTRSIFLNSANQKFTKNEIAAHRLSADALCMAEAETALSRTYSVKHDVVSAAMKIGRARMTARQEAIGTEVCGCVLCTLP